MPELIKSTPTCARRHRPSADASRAAEGLENITIARILRYRGDAARQRYCIAPASLADGEKRGERHWK